MKKNKLIILASIIVGVLVVTLGLTYAAITFNETKGNSKLVLGDIWMHYNETNQLVLSDAMPIDIKKYTTYKVNPVMASQEVVDNELNRCVNYLNGGGMPLDDGTTMEEFCKGTGTANEYTFQQNVDNGDWFPDYAITYFEENNIILIDDNGTYTVNPIMASQEVVDNELSRCISYYNGVPFDEGSDAESFCKGTGTIEGRTLEEGLALGFDEAVAQKFLDSNIIIPQIENLPYFEFTIDGKNTYTKKDIWYEIVLNHGDEHATRTTRIKDELLKFTLVEVVDETETVLRTNVSFNDLRNRRIWVDTIPANTNEEINKTYRLYMWISSATVIGNVEEDYTIDEWNDVFASIKVNVTGDFNEKEIELEYEEKYNVTDASCFEFFESEGYIHNRNINTQELEVCKTFIANTYLSEDIEDGESIETFCQGTGTIDGELFQFYIDNGDFLEEEMEYLQTNNIITSIGEVVTIKNYFINCGSDVVIPKTINGKKVTRIFGFASYAYFLTSVVIPNTVLAIDSHVFAGNALTSVTFEENSQLTYIRNDAFAGNRLTNIEIPSSVVSISPYVFEYNQLTSVIFKENSNLTRIDYFAFWQNQISNVNIPDSVTYLSCRAFDDDVVITKNENLTCIEGPEL